MCNYFQEQTKDSVRQIIFSSLFSPQGNKADDSRMSLLGKLVSMAVAVCRIPVLECAASWLQVLLQVSEDVSFIAQLVKNLPACNTGNHSSIPGWGRSPVEGIGYPLQYSPASLVAQLVKNPPTMQETSV